LIAIKMSALTIGGKRTILFTKILDYASAPPDDDDAEYEAADRNYWQKRRSPEILQLIDSVGQFARQVNQSIALRFNRGSIVLKVGDRRGRLLTMWPQKKAVKMSLPCAQSGEIERRLEEASIDYEGYDERRRRYVLRLLPDALAKQAGLLTELISAVYRQAEQSAGDLEE
jgi:hypothetical protein